MLATRRPTFTKQQAIRRGYLVLENDTIVGTYAFRSPPRNGEVEIAYFTFPEFEGRGFATEMASFDPNREGHGARDQDFCVYVA
jgi:RimJ/RimL family protein N-acetyltransferase